MTRKQWIIWGTVALILICLGCGGALWSIGRNLPDAAPSRTPTATSPSAPSAATPTPPAPSASAPASSPSSVPPDPAAYIADLRQIDSGLVVNEARAIRRAEETCADIKGGLSGDALTQRVVARLSGGNAVITAAQARQAIALMQTHICR